MSFGWMDGRDGMGGGDLTGWGWTGGMNERETWMRSGGDG
jgi:hypothetical protein